MLYVRYAQEGGIRSRPARQSKSRNKGSCHRYREAIFEKSPALLCRVRYNRASQDQHRCYFDARAPQPVIATPSRQWRNPRAAALIRHPTKTRTRNSLIHFERQLTPHAALLQPVVGRRRLFEREGGLQVDMEAIRIEELGAAAEDIALMF